MVKKTSKLKIKVKYIESKVPKDKRVAMFERGGQWVIGHPDMIKTCEECNTTKNQTFFTLSSNIDIYGRRTLRNVCSACMVEQHRQIKKIKDNLPYESKECECCGKTNTRLFIDHNHTTGIFRGWLCHKCNSGIGLLGDQLEGVEKAIKYLRRTHEVE